MAKWLNMKKCALTTNTCVVPLAFNTFGFLASDAASYLIESNGLCIVMLPSRSMNVVFKKLSFVIQKTLAAQLVARLASI